MKYGQWVKWGCGVLCMGSAVLVAAPSTVSFQKTQQMAVKVDQVLADLTVNATVKAGQQQQFRGAMMQKVNALVPEVKWRIASYQQNQASTGAINIALNLRARITQAQVDQFNTLLAQQKDNNQKMKISVVSRQPGLAQINQAKQQLMLAMYQSIQHYTAQFNHQAESHYVIQSIRYQSNNLMPPQ